MAFAKTPKRIRTAALSVHFEIGLKRQLKKTEFSNFLPNDTFLYELSLSCELSGNKPGSTEEIITTSTSKPNTQVKESCIFMYAKPLRSAE